MERKRKLFWPLLKEWGEYIIILSLSRSQIDSWARRSFSTRQQNKFCASPVYYNWNLLCSTIQPLPGLHPKKRRSVWKICASLWYNKDFLVWEFFCLFRAAPAAYRSSQARGRIRATAAGLHHSTATRDLSCIWDLHHSSEHRRILNPWSKAREQTCVLMDTSWVHYWWTTTELQQGLYVVFVPGS